MIEIRFCELNECDKLKLFIHRHWYPNHILSTNIDLLDFQHKGLDKYNFVIAEDKEIDEIVGILGFIPISHYDESLEVNKDLWLAVWKVIKTEKYSAIGFQLLNFIINKYKPNSIGAIGINKDVVKLYQFMKYSLGKLNHYYLLNPNILKLCIAKVGEEFIRNSFEELPNKIKLKEIIDLSDVKIRFTYDYQPQKSIQYLVSRYQKHPIYSYKFYGVYESENIKLILVTRKVFQGINSCLRIVDIFGDFNFNMGIKQCLVDLLIKENSEYVDCLNSGLPTTFFTNLGLNLVNDDVIIPNYFEPFVDSKVDILYGIKSKNTNYIIFKGDSDQDRPSILV